MNYEQIINMLKAFAAQHKQIKVFGYGNISDIEVPVDPITGLPIQRDYPYMFLNPTNHSITAQTITYRFNVIVMEFASEQVPTGFSGLNSIIKAQSDCLYIINDLLGWIEYNTQYDTDLVENTAITPFQERFMDTVAGMTATLEFQVRNTLNLCDAPIYNNEQLITAVQEADIQIINSPSSYLEATTIYEVGQWWLVNTFDTQTENTSVELGTIELTANVTLTGAEDPFKISINSGANPLTYLSPDLSIWPNAGQIGMNIPVKLVWSDISLINPGDIRFGTGGINTADILVENLQIKFYKAV